MKRKILGVFFVFSAVIAGMFLRFYSPHVDGFYDAYRLQGLRVVHLIISDNGTPDDTDDDWIVDWEYR